VADHARVWARQMTVADPTHVVVAHQLREQLWQPRLLDGDPLIRDLADYDCAFRLDGQVA
jgi:hypothetical protein